MLRLTALLLLALCIFALIKNVEAKGQGWTKETFSLQNKMVELGFTYNLSGYVINKCKETAQNPRRCVNTATFIAVAESGGGKYAKGNNVWGINEGKTYASPEANFERWLKSYNKYWYNQIYPSSYYPPKGKVSITRYCTDEHSSKSKVGCPNGLKHANKAHKFITN